MATKRQVEMAARAAEMIRLRGQGLSMEAIGRRFPHEDGRPLSKQAVCLVLQGATAHGCEVPQIHGRSLDRVNALTAKRVRRTAEAEGLFRKGHHPDEIASALGLSAGTVRRYLRGLTAYRKTRERILHTPRRAQFSQAGMRTLRDAGVDVRTIAARAGVSRSRVYQILRDARWSR